MHGYEQSIVLTLPPLATLALCACSLIQAVVVCVNIILIVNNYT